MGLHLVLLGASSNQFLWIVFWWIGCEDSPMSMSWNSCAKQPLNQQPEILLLLLYNVTWSGMGELHRTRWGKMEHSFSGTVCAYFLLWPLTCFLSDNLVPITYGHVVKGFPSWVLVCWLSFQVLLFLCCLLTHSGVVNNFHFLPRSFFKLKSCKKLCILLCLFLVSWSELIKSFFVLHESSGLALSETGCWHKIMCNGCVICRHIHYAENLQLISCMLQVLGEQWRKRSVFTQAVIYVQLQDSWSNFGLKFSVKRKQPMVWSNPPRSQPVAHQMPQLALPRQAQKILKRHLPSGIQRPGLLPI